MKLFNFKPLSVSAYKFNKFIVIFFAILFFCNVQTRAIESHVQLQPSEVWQSRINKVAKLIEGHFSGKSSEKKIYESLNKLVEGSQASPEKATVQAVYFLAEIKESDERRRSAAQIVVSYFYGKSNQNKLANIIIHGLDSVSHRDQKYFEKILDKIVYDGTPEARLSEIEYALASHPTKSLPATVADYMYATNPDDAIVVFANLYIEDVDERNQILSESFPIRAIVWKKKNGLIKNNQTTEKCEIALKHLAENKRWWVRLFVAYNLRAHAEFRQASLVSRLEADPNNSVVRVVASFSTKNKRSLGKNKSPEPN